MKSKDKIILTKILKYIDELHWFIHGYSKEQFDTDRKTINACVFDLSQISELTSKISNELINKYPDIEWRRIKSFKEQNCSRL